MINMLKDKTVYNKIILSIIPLTAICSTALSALIAGIITIFAVLLSAIAVSGLKRFLTEKTGYIARTVIAIGIVGILTMAFSVFFKDIIESVSLYLPLISVITVILISTKDIMEYKTINVFKYSIVVSGVAAGFLFVVGLLKEILGQGSVFGFDLYTKFFAPIEFFKTPAGALLICAALTILYNVIVKHAEKRREI